MAARPPAPLQRSYEETIITGESLVKSSIYRNIQFWNIVAYRLPPAGIVSLLHRLSGALVLVLLPLCLWLFEKSVSSAASFGDVTRLFDSGLGLLPGWVFKVAIWLLSCGYITHFTAGVRHLWMDASHRVSAEQGRRSALLVLGISTLLCLLVGAKILGLY